MHGVRKKRRASSLQKSSSCAREETLDSQEQSKAIKGQSYHRRGCVPTSEGRDSGGKGPRGMKNTVAGVGSRGLLNLYDSGGGWEERGS